MAKPDFTLLWGVDRPGGIPADVITADNYKLGWQFRAGVPPLTINFDYYQNLNDLRTIWLSEQFPVNGTTTFTRTLMELSNDAQWRAGIGSNDAGNIAIGTLSASRLAESGVTAGSYGNTTNVPVFTVDSKGRVVDASTVSIAFPAPPSGNEGQAGLVQEATQAEVDSRAAVNKYIRPDKAGYGFTLDMNPNGGVQFPFWLGGWSLRWGEVNVGGNTSSSVYTFGVSLSQCFVCAGQASLGDNQPLKAAKSGNSIRVYNSDSNTQLARWWGVGRNA